MILFFLFFLFFFGFRLLIDLTFHQVQCMTIQDGLVTQARLALGSVAPVPIRLRHVEDALIGSPIHLDAVKHIEMDIAPIDDIRSTATYRMSVAKRIVRSWLEHESGEP